MTLPSFILDTPDDLCTACFEELDLDGECTNPECVHCDCERGTYQEEDDD